MAQQRTRGTVADKELGEISREKLYPLPVFRKITGLGKHAFAQLRRHGLKTVKCGNRVFVRGEDFDAFLAKQTAATN